MDALSLRTRFLPLHLPSRAQGRNEPSVQQQPDGSPPPTPSAGSQGSLVWRCPNCHHRFPLQPHNCRVPPGHLPTLRQQGICSLIDSIYTKPGTDPDCILPFAVSLGSGREIECLGGGSELTHRIALANTLRLVGKKKASRNLVIRPTQIIFPSLPIADSSATVVCVRSLGFLWKPTSTAGALGAGVNTRCRDWVCGHGTSFFTAFLTCFPDGPAALVS